MESQSKAGLMLLRRKAGTLLALAIGGAILGFGVSFLIAPTYVASVRILPPAQQQNISGALAAQLGALALFAGGSAPIKNPADQYVSLLKSRSIYDALIQRFNLRELYDERYIEDTRKE